MESFFGTLKTELVHHREYPDRDTARRDLFTYVEGYLQSAAHPLRHRLHHRAAGRGEITRNPVSTFPGKVNRHHDKQKVMTLGADEFIHRFLLHVLPDGFHRIIVSAI